MLHENAHVRSALPQQISVYRSTKEALKKSAFRMKRKASGAQRPRHIKTIGAGASTGQRSDSLAQPFTQWFPSEIP